MCSGSSVVERSDHARRNAAHQYVRCDVTRDDGARRDDRTRADGDPWKHHNARSKPRAPSDHDRAAFRFGAATFCGTNRVIDGEERDVVPDEDAIADSHFAADVDVERARDEDVVAEGEQLTQIAVASDAQRAEHERVLTQPNAEGAERRRSNSTERELGESARHERCAELSQSRIADFFSQHARRASRE